MAEEIAETDEETIHHVGAQLRAAREEKGLTLKDVAAETRIPQRHLESIEKGDFTALPGRTYAIGFSRTYAQTVGLDDDAVVGLVRAELDAQQPTQARRPTFEPGDPARVPSARLGWLVAGAALVLLVGLFFFFRPMFSLAADLPPVDGASGTATAPLTGEAAQTPNPAQSPALNRGAGGPVVFTALADGIWVKFYTAGGNTLLETQLAKGESYTVPAGAQQPLVWTGRPEALKITVGGRDVPKLAQQQTTVKDVPITPGALLGRSGPGTLTATPAT